MIAVLFLYEARDPESFEAAYGPNGEWAQFFAGARGYIGTELLRDIEQAGRYVVVDRWESAETFNEFIETNRDEYLRRSDDMAFHYVLVLWFGSFESTS